MKYSSEILNFRKISRIMLFLWIAYLHERNYLVVEFKLMDNKKEGKFVRITRKRIVCCRSYSLYSLLELNLKRGRKSFCIQRTGPKRNNFIFLMYISDGHRICKTCNSLLCNCNFAIDLFCSSSGQGWIDFFFQ